MSGGHFEYKQYHIDEIAREIKEQLEKQGKEKPKGGYFDQDYLDKYPEERYYYTYPKEIQKEFKKAIKHLKIAGVYAQRIDYLLSGDDGKESFLTRLKEELSQI